MSSWWKNHNFRSKICMFFMKITSWPLIWLAISSTKLSLLQMIPKLIFNFISKWRPTWTKLPHTFFISSRKSVRLSNFSLKWNLWLNSKMNKLTIKFINHSNLSQTFKTIKKSHMHGKRKFLIPFSPQLFWQRSQSIFTLK